jgi:predicted Rossmann fold nucleotide-binding protein DprA/Smf involved in DNA uptake
MSAIPRKTKSSTKKVLEHGAILREFPLRTPPSPENFPIRNRIVAGMPLGALIVERAQYSGPEIYATLSSNEPRPIDDIVENTGLNSSDVLATLFDLEMKGFVRQLPGKLFSKVLL